MNRRSVAKALYRAGWAKSDLDDTMRSRIYHVISDMKHWSDWGHAAMWLVGRNDSGSAGAPRGRDLYYAHIDWMELPDRSWFAGQTDRHGFVTTTDHDTIRKHRSVPWKIFDLQDDGRTLVLGWWPEPGSDGRIRPDSIEGNEIGLFWRWYWIDHLLKAQWLGLRQWVYYRALTAAVHQRRPFACNVTPDPGSGGYSHWHCQGKKRHRGAHTYHAYRWDGPGSSVRYAANA